MRALVLGAGGFIGNHLVSRLKMLGHHVTGIDLKYPEFSQSDADDFIIGDLRMEEFCMNIISKGFDEVYQLAADMGGAGYIFTGEHDFDVMHNSAAINLNVCKAAINFGKPKVFYSSSACIYPRYNQQDPSNPKCSEDSVYPADPDSEYGWEKLFSERIYLTANRNYHLDVKIARFHNVYGELSTWMGGKEKAPAAICRKVAEAVDGGVIEIWGTGEQTRSFLYIEDCLDGILKLMNSSCSGPYNIGSEEMITINDLAKLVMDIAGKELQIQNISGPVGVMGRNSDNKKVMNEIQWSPKYSLREGMSRNYQWVSAMVHSNAMQKL